MPVSRFALSDYYSNLQAAGSGPEDYRLPSAHQVLARVSLTNLYPHVYTHAGRLMQSHQSSVAIPAAAPCLRGRLLGLLMHLLSSKAASGDPLRGFRSLRRASPLSAVARSKLSRSVGSAGSRQHQVSGNIPHEPSWTGPMIAPGALNPGWTGQQTVPGKTVA